MLHFIDGAVILISLLVVVGAVLRAVFESLRPRLTVGRDGAATRWEGTHSFRRAGQLLSLCCLYRQLCVCQFI